MTSPMKLRLGLTAGGRLLVIGTIPVIGISGVGAISNSSSKFIGDLAKGVGVGLGLVDGTFVGAIQMGFFFFGYQVVNKIILKKILKKKSKMAVVVFKIQFGFC